MLKATALLYSCRRHWNIISIFSHYWGCDVLFFANYIKTLFPYFHITEDVMCYFSQIALKHCFRIFTLQRNLRKLRLNPTNMWLRFVHWKVRIQLHVWYSTVFVTCHFSMNCVDAVLLHKSYLNQYLHDFLDYFIKFRLFIL